MNGILHNFWAICANVLHPGASAALPSIPFPFPGPSQDIIIVCDWGHKTSSMHREGAKNYYDSSHPFPGHCPPPPSIVVLWLSSADAPRLRNVTATEFVPVGLYSQNLDTSCPFIHHNSRAVLSLKLSHIHRHSSLNVTPTHLSPAFLLLGTTNL